MPPASFSGGLLALRRRLRERYGAPRPALFADPAPPALPPPPAELAARIELARDPELRAALSRLDAWQLAALLAPERAVLVRAQAGSGKTGLLALKVRWLHEVEGVPLERIVVLTFTCKAARELRCRIDRRLWAGTFHALAHRLLGGGRQVLDAALQQALWEELIERHGLAVRYRGKLARRMEALARGQPLYGNMRRPDDLERLADLAEEARLEQGQVDFDGLLREACERLRRRPLDPPPAWVLVDELQDCDGAQLELVRALCRKETRLFAVGDPSQAIYAWRGSTPALFERFERQHRAACYTLPVNYRCSGTIAACARVFLRDGAELVATRPRGEPLAIVRHHDPSSEARYLAGRLAELHAGGLDWSRIGLLFRLREQDGPLREGLLRAGLPAGEIPLLTIHAAKGLEFDQLFLCGANDGLLPLAGPGARAELLAEEQRLFHVALTRARERVEISWYVAPGQRRFLPRPSPFLQMLPANLVRWSDSPAAGPPPAPAGEWRAGQQVRHRRYGTGRVVALDERTVTVEFERYGKKSFSLAVSGLSPAPASGAAP